MFDLVTQWLHGAELKLLVQHEQLIVSGVGRLEQRMETMMSALTDSFATAFEAFKDHASKLETALDAARSTNASLSAQVGTLTAANAALQTAGTDADAVDAKAKMQAAIDGMMALTTEMDSHLAVPAEAPAAPAPELPAAAVTEPAQTSETAQAATSAPATSEPVVPAQGAATDPVVEAAPVESATTHVAEPENAEDRAAVAPASTTVP